MFIASALLGQRLIRILSLTSLSAPRGRLVSAWLSALLVMLATIASISIVALYISGASRATDLLTSDASSDDPQRILTLLRVSMAWLAVLGALPPVLVAVVLLATRTYFRRLNKVKKKLIVFFLGGTLLENGQFVRLAAVFQAGSAAGRGPFYVAGFMLEALVVLLYAIADLDLLFHDEHINTFALANDRNRRQPRAARFGFFRNDEQGIPRGALRDQGGGGINIRKSVDISVAHLDEGIQQPRNSSSRDEAANIIRSPSSASTICTTSSMPDSVLSNISALSAPAGSAGRAKWSREETTDEQQVVSPARSIWNMNGDPSPSLPPPPPRYDPLTTGGRRRAGLRQLEQQLDDYETAVQQPEDSLKLY